MKIPRKQYTTEFKRQAVSRIHSDSDIPPLSRELDVTTKTLRKWWQQSRDGLLDGPGTRRVTQEQMELSHLRSENSRLKRENQILKKAAAYFAKDIL
jgi:transposase